MSIHNASKCVALNILSRYNVSMYISYIMDRSLKCIPKLLDSFDCHVWYFDTCIRTSWLLHLKLDLCSIYTVIFINLKEKKIIYMNILGVSQYTGISVYCNTEQNYIVSRYKSYIPVYVFIFYLEV